MERVKHESLEKTLGRTASSSASSTPFGSCYVGSVRGIFGQEGSKLLRVTKQQQYKSILEKHLIPHLHEWTEKKRFTGTGDIFFIHIGAPCHKGQELASFLKDH